jgi:hypothetical protein
VHDREAGVLQLVALAFLEDDVLQLVILGDPDRASSAQTVLPAESRTLRSWPWSSLSPAD